jgi:hypothetical protein
MPYCAEYRGDSVLVQLPLLKAMPCCTVIPVESHTISVKEKDNALVAKCSCGAAITRSPSGNPIQDWDKIALWAELHWEQEGKGEQDAQTPN